MQINKRCECLKFRNIKDLHPTYTAEVKEEEPVVMPDEAKQVTAKRKNEVKKAADDAAE